MRLFLVSTALMLLGSSVACTSVDSEFYSTSGIYAALSAKADGSDSTIVSATFNEGGPGLTFLELTGGDEVNAHMSSGAESADKPMQKKGGLGVTYYEAEFYIDSAGSSFRIDLDCSATGNASAPNSTATLPEPFDLTTSPASLTTFSRANDDWSLFWTTQIGSDPQGYEIEGDCVQSQSAGMVADYDAFDFGPSYVSILPLSGQENVTCDVTFRIYRTRAGSVDPAFGKGGVYEGTQVRELVIQSTP